MEKNNNNNKKKKKKKKKMIIIKYVVVEHLTPNREVIGLIPTGGTTFTPQSTG